MKDWFAGIFWLIAAPAAAIAYFAIMGRVILVALRTGRLLGRGVIYDRTTQPGRYWFLTVTSVVLGLTFIFVTVLLIVGFLRHWNA